MVLDNIENPQSTSEATSVKRTELEDAEELESKKVKISDENEVLVTVNDSEELNDFEQLQAYYEEAISLSDADDEKASDLFKVIINEGDRLLRQKYEEDPSLFDALFYLIFGDAFYCLSLYIEDKEEEKDFLGVASDRLNTAVSLAKESSPELVTEIMLTQSKVECRKLGMSISDCLALEEEKDGEEEEEEDEHVRLWAEITSHIESITSTIEKGLSSWVSSGASENDGRFAELGLFSVSILGQMQEHFSVLPKWALVKRWFDWVNSQLTLIQPHVSAHVSVLINKELAFSLITMANFYFTNVRRDDDSDDDSDEESIDQDLVKEMSYPKAKDLLLEAISHLKKALEDPVEKEPETLCQLYALLGEAQLNLGNICSETEPKDQSEAMESQYYSDALSAFKDSKKHHSEGLYPEGFDHFIDEWSKQLE